jgi:hypothetical protein
MAIRRRRAHAAALAVDLEFIAWAATMYLVTAHAFALVGLLTVQSLLLVATLCYAVYQYGE